MTAASPKAVSSHALASAALITAAAGLLAWVIAQIPAGAFFSVDGGVKLLGVRALEAQGYGAEFFRPSTPWVAELWRGDAFPFRPPFALATEGGWNSAFPLPFLALSSIGHGLGGELGLYFVPWLATLGTWACVAWRFRTHPWRVGLVALSIGSFASIYGATFWEHTPALFLVSVALLGEWPASTRAQLLRGLLLGAVGFLRPEAWILGAAWLVAPLLTRARRPRQSLPTGAGFAAMAILFVVHNLAVYGSPLGAHAQQLGEAVDAAAGTTGMGYAEILGEMLRVWVAKSPALWALLLLLGLSRQARRRPEFTALALALIVIIVVTPALLPNAGGRQWGPRYWIVALPLLWQSVALLREEGASKLAPAILGLAATAGIALNSIYAARVFERGYRSDMHRLAAALEVIDGQAVALAVPLHAGELAGHLDRWPFFLARDTRELVELVQAMPPSVRRITWIVPAAASAPGTRLELGPELDCVFDGQMLEAHFAIVCERGAHSTGE